MAITPTTDYQDGKFRNGHKHGRFLTVMDLTDPVKTLTNIICLSEEDIDRLVNIVSKDNVPRIRKEMAYRQADAYRAIAYYVYKLNEQNNG